MTTTLAISDDLPKTSDPAVRSTVLLGFPPVLDACCGSRMFWYDRKDSRAIYLDKRRETHVIDNGMPGTVGRKQLVIDPDILGDFTDLPFPANTFALVVFDPPHIRRLEARGVLTKKYGVLIPGWQEMLRAGFEECFRVLRPEGTLIFKWCEVEIPLADVLSLTDHKPLFGHQSGAKAQTHWVAFLKPNDRGQACRPEPSNMKQTGDSASPAPIG